MAFLPYEREVAAPGPRGQHRQRLPVCGRADPLAVRRPHPQPRPRRRAHPAALLPRRGRPPRRARLARRHPVPGAAGPRAAPGSPGAGTSTTTPASSTSARPWPTWPACPSDDLRDADGRAARRAGARRVPRRRPATPPRGSSASSGTARHCGDLLHLAEAGELPAVAPAGRARAGAARRRGRAVPERHADQPHLDPHRHSARAGTGCSGNVFYDRETGERVVPNDETTWHRSAEWLRPAVRTVFEMVNDTVLPQGAPRGPPASTRRSTAGADYSTMALIRASGSSTGAGGLGDLLPDPTQLAVPRATRRILDDGYYSWGTQVDDLGLQQMLQLCASTRRRRRPSPGGPTSSPTPATTPAVRARRWPATRCARPTPGSGCSSTTWRRSGSPTR